MPQSFLQLHAEIQGSSGEPPMRPLQHPGESMLGLFTPGRLNPRYSSQPSSFPLPAKVLRQVLPRNAAAGAGASAWMPKATGFRATVAGSELKLSEQTLPEQAPLPPASQESAPWP